MNLRHNTMNLRREDDSNSKYEKKQLFEFQVVF